MLIYLASSDIVIAIIIRYLHFSLLSSEVKPATKRAYELHEYETVLGYAYQYQDGLSIILLGSRSPYIYRTNKALKIF